VRYRWLIVDGYSLLHRDPDFAGKIKGNLQSARRQLARKIEKTATALADRVTVVFDGQQAGGSDPAQTSPVEVIFSPAHQTADTVIERLVQGAADVSGVLVVTSDRLERESVTAAGAQAMSCASFLEAQATDRIHVREKLKRQSSAGKPTIGDIFPNRSS
jgi:predicted RNA-binding protein with PIN domain